MNKAFTLIELLIVIAIIGILTGVASISYSGIQARGRDSQRQNDLAQIKLGLSTYYNAQTPVKYVSTGAAGTSCTVGGTPACEAITINNTSDVLTAALKPNFMPNLPLDPQNTGDFVYRYQSNNMVNGISKDFRLMATFENKNNKKGWGGGTAWQAFGYIVVSE